MRRGGVLAAKAGGVAAQAANAGADGVIVGSRLVRAAAAAAAADPATAVRDVVGAFSAALRRPAAGM